MNDSIVNSFRIAIQENAQISSTSANPGTAYSFTSPTFNWSTVATVSAIGSGALAQRVAFSSAVTSVLVNVVGAGNFCIICDDVVGMQAFGNTVANGIVLLSSNASGAFPAAVSVTPSLTIGPVVASGVATTGLYTMTTYNGPFGQSLQPTSVPTSLSMSFFSW